ncbi:MAG: FAD-dependent oxidoreductase [Deltaproteobacteria bacterium]|nr:FAD-dependent oxidoreductase [Deltaproteobacteria bacterium]MBI4373992.1 FAD-dependent oxidoreductase [Deltaproteobacteria bacterium]
MRGFKTLLLEKKDFAAGTTGASSGMIHGGPRYLLSDPKTTKLSSQDAGYIRKIAPHLCFRIPFLYPVVKGRKSFLKRRIELGLVETFFQAYDRYSKLKGGMPHTRLTKEETWELEPAVSKDIVGAVTFDEWGIDTARLCLLNALDARNHGATVRNHTEVTRIIREGDSVIGLVARNLLHGDESEYRSSILFNATGPWAPRFAAMAGVNVKLRPSKGIHLVLDRRITNVAVISRCIDGREIFINPHENFTLLGTTDDDFYGDPDQIPVTEDEVEYLLQGMERTYPEIRKARVISTTRGIRPTLFGDEVYESALSRDHRIFDHEKEEGVKGILSMAGGKLAAYRQMAEEATDKICERLKRRSHCKTDREPLPGGDSPPNSNDIALEFDLHPFVAGRLVARHGGLAKTVLNPAREKPAEKRIVCPCEPITAREIGYAVEEEMAETLGDLQRRTSLAKGPCQGCQCLLPALEILSPHDPIRELKSFLEESWEARKTLITAPSTASGPLLAQEEMLHMIYEGVLDLGNQ